MDEIHALFRKQGDIKDEIRIRMYFANFFQFNKSFPASQKYPKWPSCQGEYYFSLSVSQVRLVCGDTGGRLGAVSRASIPSGDTLEEVVINNNNIPHLR